MNPADLVPLLTSANAGSWLLFTALLVGLIVRLVKINPTISAALPPRVRPWLAVALGLAGGVANKIVEGTAWKTALLGGALAGMTAILGHQFVIESVLAGKEIGVKPASNDTNGTTGGGTPYRDPAPPGEPAAVVITVDEPNLRAALARFKSKAHAFSIHRMPGFFAATVASLLLGLMMTFAPGCGLFTSKNIHSALDAVQIACVFESDVSDSSALADACGIAHDLIPILGNLVGEREAAKKAGVHWHADAGADAAEGGAR